MARKKHIRPIFRFSIWLAYLGGEALAIYALATLFNRRSKVRYSSATGSQKLEVLWAPIVLMHLGGQITISAYNIEDNELWRRHIVTAVSHVAVALYVFCKSWSPSAADGRLLAAAILLFILGFIKCFEKPLALKRNTFSSIVSSFYVAPRTKTTSREVDLEEYIQDTRDFIKRNEIPPTLDKDGRLPHMKELSINDRLFVDFAYAYPNRLAKLKSFWFISGEEAYETIRLGISNTFNIIYTKFSCFDDQFRTDGYDVFTSFLIWLLTLLLPIVPIGLFHSCRKEGYSGSDIKVTFSLLYITYLLEISSFFLMVNYDEEWTVMVAQHSLIGHLAYSRRRTWLMGITELLQCLKPSCYSSKDITALVHDHVRDGWTEYITDVESYWKFNDMRGHLTLERNGCEQTLRGSIEKPFDESVITWHVATDFCFYHKGTSSNLESATLCKQISNYMMHLLFSNPEMLMPGSRGKLFKAAYGGLEIILQGEDVSRLEGRQIDEMIIDELESRQGIIRDAWVLAGELMRLGDAKMWEVIRGVWVEMLCYSAARCRGYLHAKSLGSGGEYLTFVSLLMAHAGLETFPEREQRVQLRLPKEVKMHMVTIRRMKGDIEEAARKKAALSNNQGNEAAAPSPEVEIVVS
ncbi:unnamed protein product [Urochloa decumbens]|uniref:DUF4220 domain-containing protein n=1 Tax=Urochloa decumbens TaxID=240449 RepID=A0ABC9D7V6_9POAL